MQMMSWEIFLHTLSLIFSEVASWWEGSQHILSGISLSSTRPSYQLNTRRGELLPLIIPRNLFGLTVVLQIWVVPRKNMLFYFTLTLNTSDSRCGVFFPCQPIL